jgi:hypothetical protein
MLAESISSVNFTHPQLASSWQSPASDQAGNLLWESTGIAFCLGR